MISTFKKFQGSYLFRKVYSIRYTSVSNWINTRGFDLNLQRIKLQVDMLKTKPEVKSPANNCANSRDCGGRIHQIGKHEGGGNGPVYEGFWVDA